MIRTYMPLILGDLYLHYLIESPQQQEITSGLQFSNLLSAD